MKRKRLAEAKAGNGTEAEDLVTVITKRDLLDIRRYEKKRGYQFNQAPSDSFLTEMPCDRLLPVNMSFVHNDVEMRCIVELDGEGNVLMVDMPFEIYERLGQVSVDTFLVDEDEEGGKS